MQPIMMLDKEAQAHTTSGWESADWGPYPGVVLWFTKGLQMGVCLHTGWAEQTLDSALPSLCCTRQAGCASTMRMSWQRTPVPSCRLGLMMNKAKLLANG